MRDEARTVSTVPILGLLFAATLVAGVIDARETAQGIDTSWWDIASTLLFSFLCFWWYRIDSDLRRYRRSRWLNVGIVMLAIVAVPYYLVRSRPAGQRGRALLGLAGFVLVLAAGTVGGAAVYTAFA